VIAVTATPRRNERVAARVVEGKALIVVIDEKKLHTLNEVGTRVWELCDGRSLDAIAAAIVDEFEVDVQTALRDVQRFVGELRALGALELESAT
jgi:pyrroloquinoline quinone biosynthesis protein D